MTRALLRVKNYYLYFETYAELWAGPIKTRSFFFGIIIKVKVITNVAFYSLPESVKYVIHKL